MTAICKAFDISRRDDLRLRDYPILGDVIGVGVTEQLPVSKTGTFGELASLIQEAWSAFGVRVQLADVAAESETVAKKVAHHVVNSLFSIVFFSIHVYKKTCLATLSI